MFLATCALRVLQHRQWRGKRVCYMAQVQLVVQWRHASCSRSTPSRLGCSWTLRSGTQVGRTSLCPSVIQQIVLRPNAPKCARG